jgi:multidrug efflux pump subunit AcrB
MASQLSPPAAARRLGRIQAGAAPRDIDRRQAGAAEPEDPASADGGNNALLVFLLAALVMVAAVVLAAAVGEWWILVPVMLVDAVATAGVVLAIEHLLSDDGEPHA